MFTWPVKTRTSQVSALRKQAILQHHAFSSVLSPSSLLVGWLVGAGFKNKSVMLVCLIASVQRYSLIYLFIFQLVAAKNQILEDNVVLPKTQSTLATSGSNLKINNKTEKIMAGESRLISGWLIGW